MNASLPAPSRDTPECAARGIFAPRPLASSRMRLFCLPYAGGSAAVFRGWPARLHPDIELVCVDPPGRGRRFAEAPLSDAASLADQLAEELAPWLDRPFALFGHSNGALVAFELARRLHGRQRTPQAFIASAKNAPSLLTESSLHALPAPALLEALRRLGGAPAAFFDTPELIELMLPVLRADIALGETYRYRAGTPLPMPLITLGGSRDPCLRGPAIEAWRREFRGPAIHREIEGDHFFIDQRPEAVIAVLNEHLPKLLPP